MKIEDDIDKEDLIVDKPSKNEYYEEIPSATGEGVIEKNSPVRNNPLPKRSSQVRDRQEIPTNF